MIPSLLVLFLAILACSVGVHAQLQNRADFFAVPEPLIQCANVALNWTARQPPYTIEVRMPVKASSSGSPAEAWVSLFTLGPYSEATAQWTVNVSAEMDITLVCADAGGTHLTASRTVKPGDSSCLPAAEGTSTEATTQKKDKGPSGATIAGAVGGSFLGVGVTCLVWFCHRRRQRRKDACDSGEKGGKFNVLESPIPSRSDSEPPVGGDPLGEISHDWRPPASLLHSCGTETEAPRFCPQVPLTVASPKLQTPGSTSTPASTPVTTTLSSKEELMAAQQIKAVAAIVHEHAGIPTNSTEALPPTATRDVDAGPLLPPAYDPQWSAPPAVEDSRR